MNSNHLIATEIHSDDWRKDAAFDAAPWFVQATDKEILALAACEWGGDYAADQVALDLEHTNPEVEKVLDYVRAVEGMGFEVSIDASDARKWLRINRPSVFLVLPQE